MFVQSRFSPPNTDIALGAAGEKKSPREVDWSLPARELRVALEGAGVPLKAGPPCDTDWSAEVRRLALAAGD